MLSPLTGGPPTGFVLTSDLAKTMSFPLATKPLLELVSPSLSLTVFTDKYPRSGLVAKHMIDIGAGVIDPDDTGKIRVVIFNHSHNDFTVRKGDKIAQLST